MIILGIETSCDETAVGVLEAERTKAGFFIRPLSNIISSQIKIHRQFGGVVPALASREHARNIATVARQAVHQAFPSGQAEGRADLIAVTKGPGLMLALLIGLNFARTLSWKWNKPLVGVNHLEGHFLSFLLPPLGEKVHWTDHKLQKIFPAICLLISGGNTQLIYVQGLGKYKIIGETRDDAAGECFDKGARVLGLDYPGGPAIAAAASRYRAKDGHQENIRISLPRPMINSRNYDFSFSGLKTALLYLVRDWGDQKTQRHIPDISYEFQEAITDVLVKKTMNAVIRLGAKSIILAGGVSANGRLREKFQTAVKAEKSNTKLFFPRLEYTTDNAIMVALAGFWQSMNHPNRIYSWKKIEADANLRIL